MEVTQENFNSLLPEVLQAISTCDFLAFDCEFSGFGLGGMAILSYDTPALVYDKIKSNISNFTVMQFGLATFSYDAPSKSFRYRAYNFYVFPRLPPSLARLRVVISDQFTFSSQADCMDFLAKQNFDFNKWIVHGVGYLREEELNKLSSELKRRYVWKMRSGREESAGDKSTTTTATSTTNKNHVLKIPEHAMAKLHGCIKAIKEFMADNRRVELVLEDVNLQERRLLYQLIDKDYRTSLFVHNVNRDDGSTDVLVKKCTDAEDHDRMQQEKLDAELEELDDAAGFCKVIKAITDSRKPILGHNLFMDLLHVIRAFCCPLPEIYEQFKLFLQQRFKNIIDTKVLAGQSALRAVAGSGMSLGDLYKKVSRRPFVQVPIVPVNPSYEYALSRENLHEAGYDAFLTGFVFIHLANYLGDQSNPRRPTRDVPWDLLRSLFGKVTPGRIQDMPYLSLTSPDLIPDRRHVFHMSFADDGKTWTNHEITPLFSPYGPVFINWIDQRSAFISLKKREHADLVRKQMIENATGSSTNSTGWRLRAAVDFLNEMEREISSRLTQSSSSSRSLTSQSDDNAAISEENNGESKRVRCN